MIEPLYYDKDGSLLTLLQWGEKHNDLIYKIVSRTTVRRGIVVSTVWVGIDMSFTGGPPVIFETMVFGGPCDQEMDRYCTEEEAIYGHFRMLTHVKDCLSEEAENES